MSVFQNDGPSRVDKFGFAPHAKGLADRIRSKISQTSDEDDTGFVIAIQGAWGSGKSTFLNLLRKELEVQQAEPLLVLDFDPWWLSSGTPLTLAFFRSLLAEMPETARTALTGVVRTLGGATQFIPDWLVELAGGEDGKAAGRALAALKESGGDLDGYLSRGVSPRKARDKVAKALIEAKQGVVVFIDDVDRLQAQEIMEVMRFLKSVGDLPKIIYVLSMDRQMVCSLLREAHVHEPERYLEKIVQSAFDLPMPAQWQLIQALAEELSARFGDVLPEKFHLDRRFNWIVALYIEKPRDISRLLNALTLNFRTLKDSVDPIDFLCVETIRVLDHEFYRTVRGAKDALTQKQGSTENAQLVSRMLRGEDSSPDERLMRWRRTNAVGILFPVGKFKATEGIREKKDGTKHLLHFRKAVGSEEHFDAYFRLEPSPSSMPSQEMESTLAIDLRDDLAVKLRSLNQVLADGSSPIEHFLKHALGAVYKSPSAIKADRVIDIVSAFDDAIAPDNDLHRLESRADLCARMLCLIASSAGTDVQQMLLQQTQALSPTVLIKLAYEKRRAAAAVAQGDATNTYTDAFYKVRDRLGQLIDEKASELWEKGTFDQQQLGAVLFDLWSEPQKANWARGLAKTDPAKALRILCSADVPPQKLRETFFGSDWRSTFGGLRERQDTSALVASVERRFPRN